MLLQLAPYFGYLASLALIIALLVKTDSKFRIYNIAGTVLFMLYGIIFHAWPVLLTNVILFFINVYYLNRLHRHRESFELIEFTADDKLIDKFLTFYIDDITEYFPAFRREQLAGGLNFVVLRDLVIANIFSAGVAPNGAATVNINYTIKKYRDFQVGKFIFEKEKEFLVSNGIKRLVYDTAAHAGHVQFLKVNGFIKSGAGYMKVLAET